MRNTRFRLDAVLEELRLHWHEMVAILVLPGASAFLLSTESPRTFILWATLSVVWLMGVLLWATVRNMTSTIHSLRDRLETAEPQVLHLQNRVRNYEREYGPMAYSSNPPSEGKSK